MSINSLDSVSNLSIPSAQIAPSPEAHQIKDSDNNVKEKPNGKALLLGSLAALAIGAGIYIATRGKRSIPHNATPSKPQVNQLNFFEKQGLKINKGIVSDTDGKLFSGQLTYTDKNCQKFVMEYKEGVLQSSEKFTSNGEFVTRKVYSTLTETGRNQEGTYPILKRRMLCYNKDGKIINGTLRTDYPDHSYFVNNRYSIRKDANGIEVTKHNGGALGSSKEKLLFEKPFETERDAQCAMGWAPLAALNSPLKTRYPNISSL